MSPPLLRERKTYTAAIRGPYFRCEHFNMRCSPYSAGHPATALIWQPRGRGDIIRSGWYCLDCSHKLKAPTAPALTLAAYLRMLPPTRRPL